MTPLEIHTEMDRRGCFTITASGEIDIANADELAHECSSAVHHANLTQLTIDLSGVAFLASAGVAVLVQTLNELDRTASLKVIASGPVARVLEITGLSEQLGVSEYQQH